MTGMYKTYYNSPIGLLEIKGTELGISSIMFVEEELHSDDVPALIECSSQIDEYFQGRRREFSLNLIFAGTEFQKQVWTELTKIPFGTTVSYKYIAESIDNSKAIRAVGHANSKNPLSIVVPCHRVIGSNGTLIGYTGGLWRKELLINHEKSL